MDFSIHKDSPTHIRLEGRLTFDSNVEFRAAGLAAVATPGAREIVLDLSGLAYLDSSALGMLLVLKEQAQQKGMIVILLNPSPTVNEIFRIVRFQDLFEIRERGVDQVQGEAQEEGVA